MSDPKTITKGRRYTEKELFVAGLIPPELVTFPQDTSGRPKFTVIEIDREAGRITLDSEPVFGHAVDK